MASTNQVMLLTSISQNLRKLSRNRRLRRKRNKKFFLLKLKSKRATRTEDSLCESIANFFDLESEQAEQSEVMINKSDHNMQTTDNFGQSMQEVAEWQNQHQLAYWKSKALALQMENQMLHKHMKRLYDNQMQQYLTYKDTAWMEVTNDEGTTNFGRHLTPNKGGPKQEANGGLANASKMATTEGDEVEEMDETSLPPTEQPGETRRKQLIEMYGSKAARINGMETALQLNFEHCINKDKPPYWPNLPLKM